MTRLVLSLAVFALLFAAPAFSGLSMGGPNKFSNFQVGVTYRVYQPGKTLGFKRNKFKSISCGQGHEPWAAATYGTYRGSLGTKTKGFALYQGHPICSNPGESTKVGTLRIMGVNAYVGVYCDPSEHCTKADGVKDGFTVQWKAKPSKPYKKNTWMQIDTARLTYTQLVKIAHGLKEA